MHLQHSLEAIDPEPNSLTFPGFAKTDVGVHKQPASRQRSTPKPHSGIIEHRILDRYEAATQKLKADKSPVAESNPPADPALATLPPLNDFLALFPHRFDFLWAEHVRPGDRPKWHTESRYPLNDYTILQGDYLYGVRFGKQTQYIMLDIDRQSPYHPCRDRLAISRIMAALEPLGLVAGVTITSSYSGGIHLYLPFSIPQDSWAIAFAVSGLLEKVGFKPFPGHLELFPNPRPYSDHLSNYAGHRLPMGLGSYILDRDFQPIWSDQHTFVEHWKTAQHRNQIDPTVMKRMVKQVKRRRARMSGRASKFLNDLNQVVEDGWSGFGQTNFILGRIAMREFVFGHVQRQCEPLNGEALVDAIVEVARSTPGFSDFCRHQEDLLDRAKYYAKSIETSRYYPYGYARNAKPKPVEPADQVANQPVMLSLNERRAQDAQERIRRGVAELMAENRLPEDAGKRRVLLVSHCHTSPVTLYRYKALWHPDHFRPMPIAPPPEEIDRPPEPPPDQALQTKITNKFGACNAAPSGQALALLASGGSGGLSTAVSLSAGIAETIAPEEVRAAIANMSQQLQSEQAKRKEARAKAYRDRMQEWLESGDPILMAEAQQFLLAQPRAKPPE
ncbi:hypothetical protein [Pantanalinema sp. GBBB05]|uniref:hypothetical protein n=1 Tax=Pantanalinema sp. GBBB05 TaxID=2604139 RepID=UPI001DA8B4C4|nr:hypothetical protein [Pantanalinema sp. GBBB05]